MEAVCLVKAVPKLPADPRGKQQYDLNVTEEGKLLLQSAKFNESPLLVASIAGPARTGKSTMLNCILKRFNCPVPDGAGFMVGHTTSDATEGIWVWPTPVVVNDRKHCLVLIDIEGCDSMQKNDDITNGLYCLGYALSTVMMWNLKGTLNEGFRTQLAKLAVATSIIMPTPEDVDHSVSVSSNLNTAFNGVKTGFASLTNKFAGWAGLRQDQGNLQDQAGGQWDEEGMDDDDEEETDPECIARMAALGKKGPHLLVLLRDFELQLASGETPDSYLARGLEVNPGLSRKQQMGAAAAKNLFKSSDIILFSRPSTGQARNQFGTLSDEELGPGVMRSLQKLQNKLASAQPRDVLQLKSPAGHLTGQLLCGFLCRLVEQINAKGMLEMDQLGMNAAYNVNAAMAVAAENSFEEMAAVEFDLVILTSSLATAVGLAAFRRLLQDRVATLQAEFRPQGPSHVQEHWVQHLQMKLEKRLQQWEDRAKERHSSVLAKEVRVYAENVEHEIRRLAHVHLPGTTITGLDEVERIWDKVLVPEIHQQLSKDKLYEVSKDEVQTSLLKLRNEFLQRQKQVNDGLSKEAMELACMIKGKFTKKVAQLDAQNCLRGASELCDNLLNLQHLILASDGGVLGRLPKHGDEVAVYSIADKAVWKAELNGKRRWNGKTRYELRGLHWTLGTTSLPRECLFRVEGDASSIMLHGMGRGYMVYKRSNRYSLRSANNTAKLCLTKTAMNFAERSAIQAAISGAVGLCLQKGPTAIANAVFPK